MDPRGNELAVGLRSDTSPTIIGLLYAPNKAMNNDPSASPCCSPPPSVPSGARTSCPASGARSHHEDYNERIPGPDLGDFAGLPINDSARPFAESWNASRLTLQEHQCRVHVSPYIYHGPLHLRIWEEKDPHTQEVIAIKNYISTYEQTRTIWMDGRPHPPDYAAHTFMGFSTGKWEGNILTVYTTHIKQGWPRRNGLPESDQATMTEHFLRHGNIMTHMSIVTDPVYLTEPLIRTDDFLLDEKELGGWLWPCEYVEEILTRPQGEVPNYLPGENPFINEYADKQHLPHAAVMGGASTMFPEYRRVLGTAKIESAPAVETAPATRARDSELHILPVQGNVYMLVGAGGNITVQVGSMGVLLVDTGLAQQSDKVIAAVRTLSDKPIRYIINTMCIQITSAGTKNWHRCLAARPAKSR